MLMNAGLFLFQERRVKYTYNRMSNSLSPSLRERREAIVREHIAAENAHDISRAIATFHHPRYEVAPFGSVSDGPQAVHDLLAGMFAGFPDFHVDVPRLHHADEAVVVEFVMTGTHGGAPLPGSRLPDGQSRCRWWGFLISREIG
jgi:hypothetical protein